MHALGALPAEVSPDSILEALLEIRYETQVLPEIVYGRIVDNSNWEDFAQSTLPAYAFPAELRQIDPDLRYAPVLQLGSGIRSLRIGPSVLSFHIRNPYPGWTSFRQDLHNVVITLFGACRNELNVSRMGLRYINALLPGLHGINSIADLNISLAVAGERLTSNLNLNYTSQINGDMQVTVRLSSKDLVKGDLPEDTSAFIDVDVYTGEDYATNDIQAVKDWIDLAHEHEKAQFFRVFSPDMIANWSANS
jgi:uncharacterized protein (TIGR04255 family)